MTYPQMYHYFYNKSEEIRALCHDYLRTAADVGVRNIMQSLIELQLAHFSELEEIGHNSMITGYDYPDEELGSLLKAVGDISLFSSDMELVKFLEFVRQRLAAIHALYTYLERRAPNENLAGRFRRLKEEGGKEAALIRDRCDLLSL